MKLLVVSHSCVTPINQVFFSEVECQTDWDITLLGPSNWIDDYGSRRGLERGASFNGKLVPIRSWPAGNIPLHVYLKWLPSVLNSERPDAIFVHHEPYAAATAQFYLANRFSINVPIGFFTWQNINKTYPFPFRQLEQMVYRDSAFACPASKSALQVLRDKGYKGEYSFMPGSLDTGIYYPRSDSGSIREKLCSAKNEVLVGYVGRVAEEKGLRTLLKGLAVIDYLEWRLIVIGTGPFESKLDALSENFGIYDRIDRIGYVNHTDTPSYLSAFDLLVLPSETQSNWKEQFGRVIIEALACGTAVIGSDSGEIPHLIHRTGGGLVFREGDYQGLSEKLQLFITNRDKREQAANTGMEYVHTHLTNAEMAGRFAELVRAAVRKN